MPHMLSNFNPFNEISRFEPLRNLDEFLSNYRLASPWNNWETEPRIKIDVSETDEAYFIKADAPGVAKEDIKVTVEGNLVTIEFEIRRKGIRQADTQRTLSRHPEPQLRTGTGCQQRPVKRNLS